MLNIILWLQEFSRVCCKARSSIDQLDPALILISVSLGSIGTVNQSEVNITTSRNGS